MELSKHDFEKEMCQGKDGWVTHYHTFSGLKQLTCVTSLLP